MGSSKKLIFVSYGITLIVFLAVLLWGIGVFGSLTGNEMGYSVFCFFVIMPLISFIMALILGANNIRVKWLFPVVFGVLSFVIPYVVFGHGVETISLFYSLIPSLLGLGIGLLIWKVRRRKQK